MVKFSKQLEASMVPEWKGAYVNYKELKRLVNLIREERQVESQNLRRSGSVSSNWRNIGSSLSNLGDKLRRSTSTSTCSNGAPTISLNDSSSDTSAVPRKNGFWSTNDFGSDSLGTGYEAELITPLARVDQDRAFFLRLDAEKLKVDTFYTQKEGEYCAQALRLEKQLLALFEVQEDLARQSLKVRTLSKSKDHDSSSSSSTVTDSGFSTSSVSCDSPLLQIVVSSKDPLIQKSPNKFVDLEASSIKEEHLEGSSDEEMEIIAHFIENVELTTTTDNIKINTRPQSLMTRTSTQSQGVDSRVVPPATQYHKHSKSLSWSSTHESFRGSLPSPEDGDSFSVTLSDHSLEYAIQQADASPFHGVKSKGNLNERVKGVKLEMFRSPLSDKSSEFNPHRPKTIIQDMIDMSLSKKRIQSSEKMLRSAFIEFYRGLGLLKSYSALNLVAFAKIMKKYDKVVRHRVGSFYIKDVERSYFSSSDVVSKLMAKVEEIFTKHFSEHDRRKAMAQLRPPQQRGGHNITFFLGIFSGASIALLVGFLLLLSSSEYYRTMGGKRYMSTVFRVFSTLGLIVLHMFMYGWNVYAWQKTRINYGFIFEFSPGTELRYRQILLVCTAFSSMLLATMITHLVISSNEAPMYYTSEFAPMAITLVFLFSLFAPVKALYRSSRMFFLRCMQHILFAPFFKVVLADFFLADQLTSQVVTFRNIEFMMCYYSGGYFQSRDEDACNNNTSFRQLMFVFSLLPYWFRFLQCLRRWKDEGDKIQLYNAGKYGSAMVAVAIKLKYATQETTAWLVLFIFFSCLATLYQLYWDLVVDWGLLDRESKNPWLRDSLILKRKYIYFVSMAVNVVLRLAWISSIQQVSVHRGIGSAGWEIIFAALEIIRRGHWNFYRLENEHLNNVGKYRAVKTVPLPFKEFEIAVLDA